MMEPKVDPAAIDHRGRAVATASRVWSRRSVTRRNSSPTSKRRLGRSSLQAVRRKKGAELLRLACGAAEAKCTFVTAVCVSVCLSVCPSPHFHTTAQTRM